MAEHAAAGESGTTLNRPLSEEWLPLFYARVTDQFSLSRQSLHNTHQWVITLAIGLVTAVLALSGQQAYPNELGLVTLLASLPLLFRFFVRSCLECAIQHRWRRIRDALDRYYYSLPETDTESCSQAAQCLRETIELYYFAWKSPMPLGKIALENLRLAYAWPFLVVLALIAWGVVAVPWTSLKITVTAVVSAFMVYEVWTFVTYHGFKAAKCTTFPPITRSQPRV